MAPIAYTDDYIRLEPSIIPFLLLIGFHISGIDIDAHLAKSLIKQIALRGESTR